MHLAAGQEASAYTLQLHFALLLHMHPVTLKGLTCEDKDVITSLVKVWRLVLETLKLLVFLGDASLLPLYI